MTRSSDTATGTVGDDGHRLRRVVVITGASAGVGRATARAFAAPGMGIGLIARGREGLEAARREVEQVGARAVVIECDVADADGIEQAAARVEAELGPIDVWVNNAMTSVFARVQDVTPAEFARVTQVTYLGAVHGTLAALRRMLPRDRGVIVQVGSALAWRSIPLQSAYCASKAALMGFTDSLRTELMHDGSDVQVTMVQLPALNTPQFEWVRSRLPRKAQPVPPIYQPELAARAVVWAADHPRREVIVGFSTMQAIWGHRLVPWLADRKLAASGVEDQQTDEPADPEAADNLFDPLGGDHGAHGRFDDRSSEGTWQFAVTRNAAQIGLGVMGAAAATLIGARASRR